MQGRFIYLAALVAALHVAVGLDETQCTALRHKVDRCYGNSPLATPLYNAICELKSKSIAVIGHKVRFDTVLLYVHTS